MDIDLRECELSECEGGARNGDGCGWPKTRCGWEARSEGGGCVLGVMLGAMGVVEVCDMLDCMLCMGV